MQEDRFDDWLTDRVARRPSGSRAREVYGADDVHEWARHAILDALALGRATICSRSAAAAGSC